MTIDNTVDCPAGYRHCTCEDCDVEIVCNLLGDYRVLYAEVQRAFDKGDWQIISEALDTVDDCEAFEKNKTQAYRTEK